MRNIQKTILIIFLVVFTTKIMAQTKAEQEIRNLEQRETQAVLKGDTVTLFGKLWAPELIVNNPANVVITRPDVAALIKAGKINYESFERIIEKISIIGNTAIVMGREEIKPQGVTDNTGKKVTRRFTNIWMKRKDNWKLVGRQATIASIQ